MQKQQIAGSEYKASTQRLKPVPLTSKVGGTSFKHPVPAEENFYHAPATPLAETGAEDSLFVAVTL